MACLIREKIGEQRHTDVVQDLRTRHVCALTYGVGEVKRNEVKVIVRVERQPVILYVAFDL